LSPIELLQPNTDYRIDVSLPNGEMVKGVSFTTGDGPFEGTPPPPNASLQHYQFAPDVPLSSCSPPQTGTCVALASDWAIEVTNLRNGNADPTYVYLYEGSFFTNLSGLEQGTPFDCVSLRSRAPSGVYSTPVELCRGDGPLLTLSGSDRITCTSEGVLQDQAQPGTPSKPEGTPSEPEGTPSEPEDTPKDPDAIPATDGAADAGGADESASCTLTAPRGGEWQPFALLFAVAAWRQSKRRSKMAR